MNDLTDNPLNDRLRQLLNEHEPGVDPSELTDDWRLLRPRLFPYKQRPFLWLWPVGLLTLIGGLGWYLSGNNQTTKVSPIAQKAVFAEKKPLRLPIVPPQPLTFAKKMVRVEPIAGSQKPTQQTVDVDQPTQRVPSFLAIPEVVITQQADVRVKPMVGVNVVKTTLHPWPTVALRKLSPKEQDLEAKLLSGQFGLDSTVFAALTRNLRRWPNAVIVCDLTTSMDPYAAQIYAWFRRNARNPNVKGVVFFTDCDSLGQQTRPGGLPGAFFTTRERDPRVALPTLLAAARNTANNRDEDENVVEALRYAQRTFPESRHLILLSDNGSGVKDMPLLASVKKPVHVIACGATLNNADAFQPDHYQIAQQTGGTIHTLEDDFMPNDVTKNAIVRVGEHYYRYSTRRGRFVKTRFQRRPVVVLGVRL